MIKTKPYLRFPSLVMWLALGVFTQIQYRFAWQVILFVFALCCGIFFMCQRAYVTRIIFVLLVFISGLFSVGSMHLQSKDISAGRHTVQASVCSNALPSNTYYKIDLCLHHDLVEGKWLLHHQKIPTAFYSVRVPKKNDEIYAKLKVKFLEPRQRVFATILDDDGWAWKNQQTDRLADTIVHKAQKKLPVHVFQIFQSIVLGDAGYLSPALKNTLTEMGVIHLFVFSGFHVGVVYILFYFFLGLFLSGYKHMIWRKKIQLALAWLATSIFLYVVLSFEIPTFRAWLFLTLYVWHQWIEKRRDFWFILSATVFIMLLLCPEGVFTVSSYLSFLAVIGIIWSLQIYAKQKKDAHTIYQKIETNFVVSMGAYLWTTFLLSFFFFYLYILT
ncbi:MAG: ComEC/Rec2 family competence protein, partial [Deltaproteobacteria bacterium]|nr:ComEC/Rec2 family competence protein [Deltaproteobacteria bacterium]